MNASELIDLLQRLIAVSGNLPVRVTYESIHREVDEDSVYFGEVWAEGRTDPSYLIDVG